MSAKPVNSGSNVPKRIAEFQKDTRGTIAIMFSGIMMFLLGLVGLAIDLGSAYRTREEMLNAADSATLSVVSAKSAAYQAAAAQVGDGEVAIAERDAEIEFHQVVMGQDPNFDLTSVKAVVIKHGTSITATVSFTGVVPTHFLEFFGYKKLPIAGTATAINGVPAYIDFYLLLDNSPSMGIGATVADQDALITATAHQPPFARNCAFACHESDYPGTDNYSVAHNIGAKTRIDVLREATQSLMDTAAATETVADQFRMSIDTFNIITHSISPITADLAAAKVDANAIDLMVVPKQGWNDDRDTDIETALDDATAKVPASDSGIDSAHTQKVVFLVTDGVSDQDLSTAQSIVPGASKVADPSRLIQTVDPAQCTAMKSKGIKIAVIYTTYNPIPSNGYYNANVAPWQDQINPHLKACASLGYFFEVAPNQGIDAAMKALFLKAVAEARITS